MNESLLLDDEVNLRENNPYSHGYIFVFAEQDYILQRDEVAFPKSNKDRYYTVKQGDNLWNLAWAAYGDSKWWWIIRDANDILFGLELSVGKTLLIPDLAKVKITLD